MTQTSKTPALWLLALACFVLAGATGALLRFGLLYGFPAELQYVNVRHAHSHLMYFGWVTPALMALIAAWLPGLTGRPLARGMQKVIGLTLALSVVAYVFFLRYGYAPGEIGGVRLPFSVIAASLNMLAWYFFAGLYIKTTWKTPRSRPLRFWDAALGFQFLASLGAWGIALLTILKIENFFWSLALTHLFLNIFADGWFVLAVLGLAFAALRVPASRLTHWSEGLLLMGLPVTFLLGMPVSAVPANVRLVASFGGALAAAGLLGNIWALWKQAAGTGWKIPLVFLALKSALALSITIPALARWAENAGLRIPYLHWLLLGFVTLGLLAAAQHAWGSSFLPGKRWLEGTVLFLLLTLIPLTGIWPRFLKGEWAYYLAMWATVLPPLAAGNMLVSVWRTRPPSALAASSPSD